MNNYYRKKIYEVSIRNKIDDLKFLLFVLYTQTLELLFKKNVVKMAHAHRFALFFLRSLPSEVVQNTCVWVCQDYSCRGNRNFGIPHIWINAVYTEALCEYRFSMLCG